MKYYLLCLSVHLLINSQQSVHDFTQVLPLEITTMVLERIPCSSLNSFYQFIMMQSVSKEVSSIIQSITQTIVQKKWRDCIQYLFDSNQSTFLQNMKDGYLPDTYQNIFISWFLEGAAQNSTNLLAIVQKINNKRKETKQKCGEIQYLRANNDDASLLDKFMSRKKFFIMSPVTLNARLEPFTNNDETLFDKMCDQKYMKELLFLNNSVNASTYHNGLMICCIAKNNPDLFVRAYSYAMQSTTLPQGKHIEKSKLALSKKLLLISYKEHNETNFAYIVKYLKNTLFKEYSTLEQLDFIKNLNDEMLCLKPGYHNNNESTINILFEGLQNFIQQRNER